LCIMTGARCIDGAWQAADVINVGVGADDDFDGELVAAKKAEDALDLIAGIDDDGFADLGSPMIRQLHWSMPTGSLM